MCAEEFASCPCSTAVVMSADCVAERSMSQGLLDWLAAALASATLEVDAHHAKDLTDLLASELAHRIDGFEIVTGKAERLPNTLNVRLPGVDAEAVMVNAPSVLMSTGSACTSRVPDASHVLQAMGMTQDEAYECLRLSVGRPTSADAVRRATGSIALAVQRVQQQRSGGHGVRLDEACERVFARHETFHPRYGWLKKAVDAAGNEEDVFNSEDAVIRLGVGKNMVKAIRHWGAAFKLIEADPDSNSRRPAWIPSYWGQSLFSDYGADPFTELPGTLWWLHWKLLAPRSQAPVWWTTFNQFSAVEFDGGTTPDVRHRSDVRLWVTKRELREEGRVSLLAHVLIWARGSSHLRRSRGRALP